MTSPPSIRPAVRTDHDALARIAEATGLFPREMLGGMIAGYLEGTSEDVWLVAETRGVVIGFVFCEPERLTSGTWNMLAIGVEPTAQGRGVGAALTHQLEGMLRDAGHRVLIVETVGTPEYARTQGFYLSNGYVEEARIREFWDADADKLVFWKRL